MTTVEVRGCSTSVTWVMKLGRCARRRGASRATNQCLDASGVPRYASGVPSYDLLLGYETKEDKFVDDVKK